MARLFFLPAFLAAAMSAALALVPPASQGLSNSPNNSFTPPTTDADSIANTALIVDQKSSANATAQPNLPVLEVVVTAVDGQLTNGTQNAASVWTDGTRRKRDVTPADFEEVFGASNSSTDCAIEGTAYLTYTLVSNSTYNVDACAEDCSATDGCVFFNLYYEFNNPLLDWVFSEKSNLKCVMYGDIHTAIEKTNCDGQQLAPEGWGETYITDSTGWGIKALEDPETPEGYEYVFGPTGGANNAPGYMGFVFLSAYSPAACADACSSRGFDAQGGTCQYFNIWRAVVSGVPETYTCSMYYIPTDASTAVNTGQGDLVVTYSRGYKRINYVTDGGFEGYTCPDAGSNDPGSLFCFTTNYANWLGTSPSGGFYDASIFHFTPYAYNGNSVGLLGAAYGDNAFSGTLSPVQPINTKSGHTYSIGFFHSSVYSGQAGEQNAIVNVLWNGVQVGQIKGGYSPWAWHEFTVDGKGGDTLQLVGGSAPSFDFVDDVGVRILS